MQRVQWVSRLLGGRFGARCDGFRTKQGGFRDWPDRGRAVGEIKMAALLRSSSACGCSDYAKVGPGTRASDGTVALSGAVKDLFGVWNGNDCNQGDFKAVCDSQGAVCELGPQHWHVAAFG